MSEEDRSLLDAWRINDRVTTFLLKHISAELWGASLGNSPRRTVRNIFAHLHNSRCSWIKGLAIGTGVSVPSRISPTSATPPQAAKALGRSGARILKMLEIGLRNGGEFPNVSGRFIWGAWPRNVALFVAYAVSHEAHHRGQILVMARELGRRLPPEAVTGLWQWSSRLKESRPKSTAGA